MPSGSRPPTSFRKLARVSRGEAAEGDFLELLGDALDVVGMAVAEAADRHAGDEVEILAAVHVGDDAALGVVDGDLGIERDRLQSRRHDLGLAVEDRLRFRSRRGVDLAGFVIDRLRRRGAFALHDPVLAVTPFTARGAAVETVNEIVGDGARGLVAILGIARPGIEIDDLGLAILADDGVAAEDLNPKGRWRHCVRRRAAARP